jgi:hypothetical protein
MTVTEIVESMKTMLNVHVKSPTDEGKNFPHKLF